MQTSPHRSLRIATRLTLLLASAVTAVALYSEKSLMLEERQHNVQQAVRTASGIVDY